MRSFRVYAYGRALKMRSCERRNLAAATIFMARVRCCVFLTELIRLRMSRRLAMETARTQTSDVCQATNASDSSLDRKSTRLNSSHVAISYAVFCLKKKKHEI